MTALMGIINIILAILVIAGVVSGLFFAWFYLIAMAILVFIAVLDS